MKPSGRYNQIDLTYTAGPFTLRFEAEWDPPAGGLFGPSGSGKSTILEIIAGARRGASGRVVLDGRTILDTERGVDPEPRLRWVGWVPQDASLFPHMTVLENVRYGLPRGGEEGERRLAAAVDLLELRALLPRAATDLSGGERQRAAIARAVGSGARVLLLDEPLASLDVPLRARVYPLFLRLRDELKLPMLYVSHDPDEVAAMAEHVLVVSRGRCVASGRTGDVLAGVRGRAGAFEMHGVDNRFAARLIETSPAEGTALIELPSGLALVMAAAPLPERDRFEVVIRGEEIILSTPMPGRAERLSAQNVLDAWVTKVTEGIGHALVTASAGVGERAAGPGPPPASTGAPSAAIGDGAIGRHASAGIDGSPAPTGLGESFVVRVTRRALADLGLRPGTFVRLIFKAGAVRPVTRTDSS